MKSSGNILTLALQFLRQPTPAPGYRPADFALLAGVIVFGVLSLFPFGGLAEMELGTRLFFNLCYGFISFVFVFLVDGYTPKLLPSIYSEGNYNIGWEIVHACWRLLVIATANYFFDFLVFSEYHHENGYWLNHFLFVIFYTLKVGIVPSAVLVVVAHNYRLRQNLAQARSMSQAVHQQHEKQAQVPTGNITMQLEEVDPISVQVENLLYIAAADNYVELYTLQQDRLQKSLHRGSLKLAEQALEGYGPLFFRCHRSFIVNMSQVTEVQGNSQGYRLLLPFEQQVPVSRSSAEALKERLGGVMA